MTVDVLRQSLNEDVVALGRAMLEQDGATLMEQAGLALEAMVEIASHAAQQGEDELARALCRRYRDLGGDPAIQIFEAFLELPQISPSREATQAALDRLRTRLAELEANPPRTRTPLLAYPNMAHFRLSYIDVDVRPFVEALARILRAACPELAWVAPHCKPDAAPRPGPLRIGIDYDYPVDHAMSVCFRDIIAAIGKAEAEVVLIAQKNAESVAEQFPDIRCLTLSANLEEARRAVAALELDVLLYSEIGMRSSTYMRAHARLARKQLVTVGHPMTTGLPTIDRFMSFDLMEPSDGKAHYTESLWQLPGVIEMNVGEPPEEVPDERVLVRQALGVPEGRRLYYAPHYIIKMQPESDEMLRRVLEADPEGIVLLYGSGSESQRLVLETRLAETLGEAASRVFFQPGHLPRDDFFRILRSVDAVLDIRPFGLGTTSYYAARVGAPIVTWPGQYLRGRVAQGLLTACGLEGFVATSLDDYVAKAVAVARDRAFATIFRKTFQVGYQRALQTLRKAGQSVADALVDLARQGRGKIDDDGGAKYRELRDLAATILQHQTVSANDLLLLARECMRHGLRTQSKEAFDRYAALVGPSEWDLHRALLEVPRVPESSEALQRGVERCLDKLSELESRPSHNVVDPVFFFDGMPHFELGYSGINVRDVNARIAKILLKWCPGLEWTAPHCLPGSLRTPGPLRVGVYYDYKKNHVMHLILDSMIQSFSSNGIRPIIFSYINYDSLRSLQYDADVVELRGELKDWRETISSYELDVLIYSEIGMQVQPYVLGFARLARVQSTYVGHPVTSGLPQIDHFVSYDLMEPADAADHYSETLVRLPRLPPLLTSPAINQGPDRAFFGLPEDAHLYYFPHNAHKIHPKVDGLLARILEADPKGILVAAMLGKEDDVRTVSDRLTRAIGDKSRIMWHPFLPVDVLHTLLQSVDVLLDLPHFATGTTAFYTARAGCPLVTYPGRFAQGRVGLALYRTLGITEGMANTDDEYVERAVALASAPDRNVQLREKIRTAYARFVAEGPDDSLGRYLFETAQKVIATSSAQ